MIVAVLGEKGGTGKTTFSTNLAGMRAASGKEVLVVDADRQGSSSYWAEAREGKKEFPHVSCVQKFGSGLSRAVRDMSRRYDDIIIDIGAGDGVEIDGALRVADLVLIPVQPSGLDVWTLGLLDDRISEARELNDRLKAYVVINRASTNPRDNDTGEAREAVSVCEILSVSEVVIRDRVAIKRSVPTGLTVCEYRPLDSKATQEMEQLYTLAFGENGYRNGN
jgi:chromosome partitioning protein